MLGFPRLGARLGLGLRASLAALAFIVAVVASLAPVSPAHAQVGIDDYPAFLKNHPMDSLNDPWGFLNRECVSFVAWRLNNDNRAAFSNNMTGPNGRIGHFGSAGNWASNASTIGYLVDAQPAVGSVASWPASTGHVGYVTAVNPNATINTEEYNWSNDGSYHTRTSYNWQAAGLRFIHIKDSLPPAPSPTSTQTASSAQPLAPVLRADGKVEVFAVNTQIATTTANVYHIEQNSSGTWVGQNWSPMWGYLTGISAIAYPNRDIELFATNTHTPTTSPNALHLKYTYPTGWDADWSLLPNTWLTSIAPVLRADGRVELFGINTKAPTTATNVYHIEQNLAGGWTGQTWSPMWGYVTSLSAVAYPSRDIELFATNALTPTTLPNALHLKYTYPNGWDADWSLLPNAWFTSLAPVLRADGKVELFGLNIKAPTTTTNIYHVEQNSAGTWIGQRWSPMWGYLTGIAGVSYTGGGIELFGVNTLVTSNQPNTWHLRFVPGVGWDTDWSLMPTAWFG